ncbi:hypothetical protein CASFOL_008878 [Castilleja foliolosa]|uniref:Uncharacterized protein n=1 Tax=Castilleja foliolosa TaxID=1961234 RepID=A0ABD3E083_9LAMI
MVELCLMASHGYPLGFHSEHVSNRVSEEFHNHLPYHRSNQELVNKLSLNLSPQQKDELRSNGGLLDSHHFARTIDSTSKRPMLVDFQDPNSDSALLSFGIAERFLRHEKILKLLSSKPIEEQRRLLDLSLLYDLVGPQSPIVDLPPQPFNSVSALCFNDDAQPLQNLIHPNQELYFNEPFLGPPQYICTGTELNDVISVISDFYTSKNTNKSSRQTMLVPYFERRRRAHVNIGVSMLAATETASLKSHDKAKISQKKKTNSRAVKERDIYNNSYIHACESLLSMMVGRKQQEGKNVILSLKKAGPQLPHLLTQLSASIAGTGIAVVLSVICRVVCSKVPFCGSRALSTGLGLGLVWLSWAVNKLGDTITMISKNYGRAGEKEEEMIDNLDMNLKDIYFRVAAVMAVVVLKVA